MAEVVIRRRGRPRDPEPKLLVPIKMTAPQRKRLRQAALDEDTTYANLIGQLLDMREDRLKRSQAAQVHPLHRPAERKSHYPGGGV